MDDVPIPDVGPDEVLVEVRATSICGTDLHIYEWNPWAADHIVPPITVGHELTGVVVDRGANVTEPEVGRVFRKPSGKQSRHQSGATRITRHPRHIKLRESRSFRRQLVQCGSLRVRMSVASEVAVSEVIREEEHNVGWLRVATGFCQTDGRGQNSQPEKDGRSQWCFHVVCLTCCSGRDHGSRRIIPCFAPA